MKIQVLSDLNVEINRLFVAGGKFATGDARVAKLLPVLQKMGEKAPAMKRLAGLVDDMLKSPAPETSLADVGVFLAAVMNTQGDTAAEGLKKAKAPQTLKALPRTNLPHSAIMRAIHAFTKKGNNYNEVEQAFKISGFNDYRLFGYLSKGLANNSFQKYSSGDKSLFYFIADVVIPTIGTPIIPFIVRDFNVTCSSCAFRLKFLDEHDYEHVTELAIMALESRPKEDDYFASHDGIKCEALRVLGRDPAYEELLLSYTGSGISFTKAAALCGLVRMGSDKGLELLLKALESNDLDISLDAIAYCEKESHMQEVADAIVAKFEARGNKSEEVSRMLMKHRNPAAAVSVFERILHTPIFCEDGYYCMDFFRTAVQVYTQERMYEVFAPLYKKTRAAGETFFFRDYPDEIGLLHLYDHEKYHLDDRWPDLLIESRDIRPMRLMMHGSSKEKLLEYIASFFKNGQRDKYKAVRDYFSAALILGEMLPSSELGFVAKGLFDIMSDVKRIHEFEENASYLFQRDVIAGKIFMESGERGLISQLHEEVYSRDNTIKREHPFLYKQLYWFDRTT